MSAPSQYNAYIQKLIQTNSVDFENLALEAFFIQYKHNSVYRNYVELIGVSSEHVNSISDIPFLPISFFKYHKVFLDFLESNLVFRSSGTTGQIRSQHYVTDGKLYEKSLLNGFQDVFGDVEKYTILATLPSYEERSDASLIYMVDCLMSHDKREDITRYYLNRYEELVHDIAKLIDEGESVLLFGVTFSLIDLCIYMKTQGKEVDFSPITIIDTGGMKGRGEDMERQEFYDLLKSRLNVKNINSEYGMTELFSQSYATTDGLFRTSAGLRVYPRLIQDPLSSGKYMKTAGLNVIDLYNINSCPFIATDDLAVVHDDRTFSITGRFAQSDLRGCQLMVDDI